MENGQPYRLQRWNFWLALRQPIGWNAPNADALADFDRRFTRIIQKHVAVLGSWSLLCMLGSTTALCFSTGMGYYFFLMSFTWGIINAALSIGIFYHALYKKLYPCDLLERLEILRHVREILFLNIGMDSAYSIAGAWLREHSFKASVQYPELWAGFGWAIIIQGIYLMVQDSGIAYLHHRNFKIVKPHLQELSLNQ
jgi:hypothetical protein